MFATIEFPHPHRQANDGAGLRVLVPLDESPQAERALLYAGSLASATNGCLKLLRATDTEDETSFSSLAQHAERLQALGVEVEANVVRDVDAVSAILDTARTWRPDVIVLATTKSSVLDRWLNGTVTHAVVSAADVPVLVVPPGWAPPALSLERASEEATWTLKMASADRGGRGRILVPLDGSTTAEQGLSAAIRFGQLLSADLILLRVVDAGGEQAATAYLGRTLARLEAVLPERQVSRRITNGHAAEAIAQAAADLGVDAIVVSTHGRSRLARTVLGSTATATLERATVPVLIMGPHALGTPITTQIPIGAPVRTLDDQRVGEVHRVVVDLDQHAVTSIVVLGRGLLARDVLVPIDVVEEVHNNEVELRLVRDEFDQLPDFVYEEFVTPPPTWTAFAPGPSGPWLLPARQRDRMGPAQQDITPGTSVFALDGRIGTVDRVELEPATGQLQAFWVRAEGVFAHDIRIPAEWVTRDEGQQILRVAANQADIKTYLGYDSRARLGR